MLYLLYGKDTFRRDERLREIRIEYNEQNPDAVGDTVIDGDDEDALLELSNAVAQGGGLFGAKVLIIAKGCFVTDKSALLKFIEDVSIKDATSTHLVLVEGVLRKSKDASVIMDLANTEEFLPLSEEERVKWIARYVKKYGGNGAPCAIGKRAAEHLAMLGDNLMSIAKEIDKLFAYSAGRDKISEADVAQLVRKPIEETIFPLSDGVCGRNPAQALSALVRLTADGEEVDGLISYTIKEARQLIRAGAALRAEIPGDPEKLFGAKPFVWRKRTRQARQWEEGELRELSSRIAALDAAWKSVPDKRLALERFIIESAPVAK